MSLDLVDRCRQVWWARKLPAGHASVLLRDLLSVAGRRETRDNITQAAIDWLCLAQDESGCGGVCGLYNLFSGWSGPYPETTGYIVPTLLQASRQLDQPQLAPRAKRMLDWLVGTQLESGAFPGGITRNGQPGEPMVFNTGQILQGLLAGWRFFNNDAFIAAATRAGDWLCGIQDEDGAWRRAAYNNIPHAYYTRVDAPLIELGIELKCERYIETARRHLAWVLKQQHPDGWFDHMEMAPGEMIHLHPIAYTIEGLWESGVLLHDEQYLEAARPGAERLLEHAEASRLAGAYRPGWRRDGEALCLTGHAQMACIWLRMYTRERSTRLLDGATAVLDLLSRLVDVDNPCPAIRGGLRGAYPITGPYMPLSIINWGTKFLIDALLIEQECRTQTDPVGFSQG